MNEDVLRPSMKAPNELKSACLLTRDNKVANPLLVISLRDIFTH
jgi:hypothetical protein